MAHVTKINKNGVYNMLAHDDRSQENIGNVDVDRSKTEQNYSFINDGQTAWQRYGKLMDSPYVHCLNRKDVNTLVSWVITAPQGLSEDRENEFFEACHAFMSARYNPCDQDNYLCPPINNVISSVVHKDETTPHLHFKFAPLVPDKKHVGEYKFSAKEVINRFDLKAFHEELDRYLVGTYGRGYFPSVRNGIVLEQGNKSINELKQETLAKINALKEQISQLLTQKRSLSAEIGDLSHEKEKLENSIANLKKLENEANKRLESAQEQFETIQHYSEKLHNGLKASLEVEELLDKIKDLADVLNDEYSRHMVDKAKPQMINLAEEIKKADSVLKKSKGITKKDISKEHDDSGDR